MELNPYPELIWLSEFVDRCPITGENIYAEDVELTLEGEEEEILLDWTLGRCEHGARWYGLLEDLFDVQVEIEMTLGEVEGFRVDDEEVRAGIWVGPPVGTVPWEAFKDQISRLQEGPTGPPPDPEAVRALPLLSEGWEIGLGPAAWFIDEAGEEVPSYAALVLDPASGIRHHDLRPGAPHEAVDLIPLILEAAVRPRAGSPGRPMEVCLADETLARTLAPALAEVDIAVRVAPTPTVDEVLADMVRSLRSEDDAPFFAPHGAQAVRAFFRAAKAFYRTRPWERIDGDKYIAFRIGEGAWGYLSVMGQMGEELGLSYFEDWLQLCRFIHNQPTPWDYAMGEGEAKAFAAAGALEGLTLEPLRALHPDDAEYLKQLGVQPPRKGLYPFPRRFTPEGLESPHLSLFDYQTIMEALAEAISKRRAQSITSIKQTFTVGEVSVTLRFPAKGDEALAENPGHFRLVVGGVERRGSGRVRVEVDAPGDARLDDVAYAIRKEGGDALWVNAVFAGHHLLWDFDLGRGAPCPRIAQLAPLSDLSMAFYTDPCPMQVIPRMSSNDTAIKVKIVG